VHGAHDTKKAVSLAADSVSSVKLTMMVVVMVCSLPASQGWLKGAGDVG
jgi:hypothetical protein